MIIWEEGSTKAQQDEAHSILDALTTAYPGHPWGVKVYEGGFFIRHLEFPANWGMNCRHKGTRFYSASAMKRDVIMMAGEWLERANLARGRYNDDPIKRVEGVPEKWQPPEYREHKYIEAVTIAPQQEERTDPRPQVDELVKANSRSV